MLQRKRVQSRQQNTPTLCDPHGVTAVQLLEGMLMHRPETRKRVQADAQHGLVEETFQHHRPLYG